MSTTIRTDYPHPRHEQAEPCLCAQMTPGYSLAPDWMEAHLEELRTHADPSCYSCKGSGVETVAVCDPNSYLNWAADNAQAVFAALGIPLERCEATIAEVRRGLIRAANTDLGRYTREERVERVTCVNASGGVPTISRGIRYFALGLDEEGIRQRLDALSKLVERDAALGATIVRWDY